MKLILFPIITCILIIFEKLKNHMISQIKKKILKIKRPSIMGIKYTYF